MKGWTKRFSSCTKCGRIERPHAGRGLCRSCYNRAYIAGSLGKKPNFLKARQATNLQFTRRPRTLKKLIPIIVYRFYVGQKISYAKKAEKAKRFIKNLLCSECSAKYINNWTNDYHTIDSVLCEDCVGHILRRLDAAIEHAESDWFKSLMKYLRYKRKAIQYELELRYKKPFYEIVKNWYITKRMSSYEIQEMLFSKYLFHISNRDLRRWLNELGLMRPVVQALRNRVVTGRMDYSVRKTAYGVRRIDCEQRGLNGEMSVKATRGRIFIEVSRDLKSEISQIAMRSKRTVSEVVRDMLKLARKYPQVAQQAKHEQLAYVLTHCKQDLLKQRIKRKRAELVYLAVKSDSRGKRLRRG